MASGDRRVGINGPWSCGDLKGMTRDTTRYLMNQSDVNSTYKAVQTTHRALSHLEHFVAITQRIACSLPAAVSSLVLSWAYPKAFCVVEVGLIILDRHSAFWLMDFRLIYFKFQVMEKNKCILQQSSQPMRQLSGFQARVKYIYLPRNRMK